MRKVLLLILLLSVVGVCSGQTTSEQMSIEWKRGEDIPLPRGGYFAAWQDGRLWLAGGSYWKDGKKFWTDEASFYDPRTGKWSVGKPIPKAFGYGVTAAIDKDLYLLGGVDGDGQPNREIYRLRNGSWSKMGESPAAFVYAAYATVGGKVYVFGGSSSATDVTSATRNVWIYDTRSNKWESGPNVPGDPRQIFSAAAVGNEIFVFGGLTQKAGESHSNLDDAHRFSTKTNTWTKIRKLPIAMRAFWAGSDGRSVFLIGGYSDAGLDTVYRYSPTKDDYELVSRLPQPLMDTKFIFVKDTFYGASGEDKLASRFSGIVIGRVKYEQK
jgi:N-acetylneuraminic acid mutarotase